MSKKITSLRGAAIAAVAASLSLATLSIAQAQQEIQAPMHAKKHVTRMHHPKWRESALYNFAPNQPRCTWPYTRMFPPCMSTWPEGDPNYHGSRRGNQWGE
jgi:hypothetical protein